MRNARLGESESDLKTSRNGFPARYRRLSPLKKLQWLAGSDAADLLATGRLQPNQVAAAVKHLNRNQRRIAAIVPGPASLDCYQDGQPFPPPADTTPMKTAMHMLLPCSSLTIDNQTFNGELAVLWPPQYLTQCGCTYDLVADWIDRTERRMDLRPSHLPASYALQRMAEKGFSIIPTTLEPEDEKSLLAEIAEIARLEKADSELKNAEIVPLAPS